MTQAYVVNFNRNLDFEQWYRYCSAAASGWAGWALAHPEFGSSVNPITNRGADYAHHITTCPPPHDFQILLRPLNIPTTYLKSDH